MGTVKMANLETCMNYGRNVLDNLFFTGKTPLLVLDMLVTLRISCQKQAKAVHDGIWVEIST